MRHLEPFDSGDHALIAVTRGDIVESEHFISFALVDRDGALIESRGDVARATYLRSSAKPLICTAVVAAGAADRFHFTEQELAIAAGSHSGEPMHVDAVRRILQKIGLTEDALQCGAHAPSNLEAANALCAAGMLPQPIHNNCSGKHAAILALSIHLGADPSGYLSPQHPAEVVILDTCAKLLDVARDDLAIAVDGCGIPVIGVPLRTAAHFFAKLNDVDSFPAAFQNALRRVCHAMLEYPEYVAGTGRFDTDLMRAAKPNILCKGGAEGYHASSWLQRGYGLTLKVADGNYRAVAPFVLSTLERFAAMDDAALLQLAKHRTPLVRNHAGTVVGSIQEFSQSDQLSV